MTEGLNANLIGDGKSLFTLPGGHGSGYLSGGVLTDLFGQKRLISPGNGVILDRIWSS